MSGATKSPHEVLDLPEGASSSALEAAYARGLSLLDAQSLAGYGMFDTGSSEALRKELSAAYEQLKAQALLRPAPPVPVQHAPGPVAEAAASTAGSPPLPPKSPPPQDAVPAAAAVFAPVPSAPKAAAPGAAPLEPAASALAMPLPADAPPAAATAKNALRVRLCAPRPEPLPEPLTGALLRQLREQLGANVDDVCEVTKINRRYIVALEEEDFSLLPATVYVRGFVSEYARVLGLGSQVAAPYVEAYTKWSEARA